MQLNENSNFKVLIIDDDPDIVELLHYNLTKEGYLVKTALDGIIGVETAIEFEPHLILLDIMMPKQDGVETCRILRENPLFKNTVIIVLTARSEEYSEVAAFQTGADDYVLKPIKPRALMSRVNSFLRRSSVAETIEEEITIGDLRINKTSYTVYKEGNEIKFPKKEFELLYFLAKHPNRVYNRETLLDKIWGSEILVVPRTVDVHIRKIREKVGEGYIKTIKGIGYSMDKS